MNKQLLIALPLFLAVSIPAYAADAGAGYEATEVHRGSIRLSEDGTGIVQNVSCEGCDFSVVTITNATVAYVKRVQMTPKQALANSKSNIGSLKFDLETQEVIEFRFYQ